MDIGGDATIHDHLFKLSLEIIKFTPILPKKYSKKIQSLSKLFQISCDFSHGYKRYVSSSILSEMEVLTRVKDKAFLKFNKYFFRRKSCILGYNIRKNSGLKPLENCIKTIRA